MAAGADGTERFCPRCGSALDLAASDRAAGDRTAGDLAPGDPPRCGNCGLVRWRDPKLAAGVLVARDDRILLVQRNHEPGLGRWSFPSGFVDRGEVVEAAALREVREEAGVTVTLGGLVGVFSEPGNPVVFVMYEGTSTDDPVAGPEAIAAAYFPPAALPPLAFAHDRAIIRTWQERRRAAD